MAYYEIDDDGRPYEDHTTRLDRELELEPYPLDGAADDARDAARGK